MFFIYIINLLEVKLYANIQNEEITIQNTLKNKVGLEIGKMVF